MALQFSIDNYKSATLQVKPELVDVLEFESQLFSTLHVLRERDVRGVWLKLETKFVDYVAPAVRLGFEFHSATSKTVTLSAWLPKDEPSKLPPCPSHFIGVGCFMLNSHDQVLVVREKSGPSAQMKNFWKLPGGLCDSQEDIPTAAERELREETGLDSKFLSISTIQEVHHTNSPAAGVSRQGTTDLYCLCVLQPVNENQQIVACETEIAEAKWMPASELLKLPFYAAKGTVFHKMFNHACEVARGKAQGMVVERLNLGFRNVENNLFGVFAKL
ncbi:hypothetical protein BASA81_007935 [Batrachochytrium salamandrivorans]|nr:hypothetical protein BASA81_007935 [Batrachochytrium salamandrivorans]